jgi:hypothetical protein
MRDEVLLLHAKAKYIIFVEKQENGCRITYPANYFYKPELLCHSNNYTFIDNKLIVSSSLDKDKENEIEVYGYDNRLLVMADLLLKAKRLGISTHLITYFEGLERRKGLLSILPPPPGDLLRKENIIKQNWSEIYDLTYYPKDAEKEGILEGFKNITNLIVKGEL